MNRQSSFFAGGGEDLVVSQRNLPDPTHKALQLGDHGKKSILTSLQHEFREFKLSRTKRYMKTEPF